MNVYIFNADTQIPEDETCYIVAKNGIYLKKKLDLIESLTPVDKISFLEEIPTFAKLNIAKIPQRMFGEILTFFREVYKQFKSECVVLIYYKKDTNSFKVHVPEQEVSFASVNYTGNHTVKDYILIGTIHSHSSMTAFHSGTDTHDEEKFDGIHFTIGKLDSDTFFDLCASIAVNGLRVPVNPIDYVNGIDVREYTNYFPQMFRPAFDLIDGVKEYKSTVKSTLSYAMDGVYSFNPIWLKKVKEKKYQYAVQSYTSNRYVFRDGKLIKIEGKNETPVSQLQRIEDVKQLTFGFEDKSANEKKNPCESCIYKNFKASSDPKSVLENKSNVVDFSPDSYEILDYDRFWDM